jgi:tetratricopeptide (TPR) repeat protein
MKEHRELMFQASQIIVDDGKKLLSVDERDILSRELNQAARRLVEVGENIDLDTSLHTVLGFSIDGIKAIQKLMQIKFEENSIDNVLALNALLTTLCPEIPEFWLYLGIAYQEKENFQKALRAYAYCHIIDVENIAAWVFSAECYINEMLLEDAECELNEAKRLIDQFKCNDEWKDTIHDITNLYRVASRKSL